MKDDVADFIAWLEGPVNVNTPQQPVVNTDPLQARVPAARPELTQADVDRWIAEYAPEMGWQDDAATDAQLGYLGSLLRHEGLFLADGDSAYMMKGQASHLIDLPARG